MTNATLATCVLLQRANKFCFLIRRKPNDPVHQQGRYIPMGGKVEGGESMAECAIREAREESGIEVHSLELRGINHLTSVSGATDWINFIYVSSDFTGEPVAGNEGYFEWVDIDKIQELDLYGGDKIYHQYLQKYKFYIAEFRYDGYDLVNHELIKFE